MLFFVGLGLYDGKDISVKGLEAVRSADVVFAEFYTSRLMGTSPEELEKFYGISIRLLSREAVEVHPDWLNEALDKDVVFLVGGDPMVSTTHLDLRLRAMEIGIVTRVIHSSSIVSAVSGITGLQNYRFGKSASIPFPYVARGKRVVTETPYLTAIENRSRDLHTLLYLDMEEERCMTIGEGIDLLLEVDKLSGNIGLSNCLGVGIARAGSRDPALRADRLRKLRDHDFGGPLHILILPAKLHFLEGKALVTLAEAPDDLIKEALQ